MARAESKMIMGYLPIEERHYPSLLSLVAPATPAVRLLDPFAGGIDLLSVDLDVDAWTRLITGGLEQNLICLP